MVKSETAAVQKQLEKKLDEKAAEILQKLSEILSEHYAMLQQQLIELSETEDGNG